MPIFICNITFVNKEEFVLTSSFVKRLTPIIFNYSWKFGLSLYPIFFYVKEVFDIAKPANSNQLINENITFPNVRLIDADGQMRGIVPIKEALDVADEAGLDLVLISPNPDNPVCKVMDYGKFLFEQGKREKEARKKQKETETKEIGIKLTTDVHDIDVKRKAAIKFLNNGDRVKVNIRFRGREMAYQNQGYEVMERFAQGISEFGQIDKNPKIEGRNMVMYLVPKKNK